MTKLKDTFLIIILIICVLISTTIIIGPLMAIIYIATLIFGDSSNLDFQKLVYAFGFSIIGYLASKLGNKIEELITKTNKRTINPNNLKETTRISKTDLDKKANEEIFNKKGETISIKDNINSHITSKDKPIKEINNTKNKGLWTSIMDDVNREIDKSNNATADIYKGKEKENIVNINPPETKYKIPRKIDWDSINKIKKITGLKGEEIVLEMEKSYLNSIGRQDLSEKIKHMSKEIGDGLGYDILSYFADGQEKYIEVKSSNRANNNSFYISQNELDFMKNNKNNSVIYRIFNINENEEMPTLRVHRVDDILGFKQITPVQYIVKME